MGSIFFCIRINFILVLGISTVSGNAVPSSESQKEMSTCPEDGSGEVDQVCPPNEEYVKCTQAICRVQRCNQKGKSITCPKVKKSACKAGCVCKAGYLRTKDADCVPEDQCHGNLICRENEIVDTCPGQCLSDYCPQSEDDENCPFENNSTSSVCGKAVCKCGFNLKRDNENGTCIPTRKCAPFVCSGINEEYNACPPACPTDDCSQATPQGKCPIIGRIGVVLECMPACRCKKGYWRKHGVCVPYNECPEVCPENAEYTNCTQAVCRAQNCNQLGQPSKPCAKVPQGKCQQGCVCNQGYLKNNNGTCVFEEDCADDLVCDIYEEVNYCPLRCDNEACPVNLGSDDDDECNSPAICGTPKCSCIEGYRRDETGTCIPISDCPDVCPENAEYTNCTQAVCRAQNCNQLGQPSKPCAKVPQGKCQQGCVCNQGYLKNKNGTCVVEEDCADDLVCDIYEEVNYCPLRCDNEACPVNLGSDDDDECNSPAICGTPKCSCIDGYKRDETGTCIPISDCPDVCPENAEYTNCTQAVCRAQNCNQLGQPSKPCAKVPQGKCQQGCVCNQGYLKNNNGTCVFEEDCADDLVCDIYEEVNYCPLRCDNEACPVNLGSDDDDECNSPAICGTPKCSCIEGYRRDETGTCIPISDCPDVCPENAEYTNCTQAVCRAQNCNQLGQPNKPCAKVPQGKCQQGCVCNQGYLKNNNGTCVFEEDCADDLVCDIYEEVNYCPLRCDNEACPVNLGSDDDDECNSPTICGTPKCSCIEGYRRDETGTCIPISDCPDVCPENAEYTNCTQAVCRAQNCNQLGQPNKPCAKVPQGKCQQGCVCNQGYLKNNNGTCVFEEDCADDLVCDIYEEVNYCPLRCDNEACPVNLGSDDDDECNSPAICGTPKCSCIEGYRRDETGTCIPISDCPDVCPENAEYTNCTQAVCRAQNCNQLGQPNKPCAKVPQGKCQQGCVCNQGYLKNNNGTCVFEEDCADDLVCDIYEEVNYCPLRCDNEACPVNLGSDDDDECNSPAICGTPKCSCIEGYRRDETGTCIPISDCPDVCPENAEYTNCTQAVCRAQNCNQLGQPSKPCAKVPEGKCQQGCVCNQGYLKNNNGTCVFEEDCADDLVCDIYEEVNYCPLRCDNEACPVNLGSDDDDECNSPAICGTPKCSCIDGYRRDETGTCIPISDCPDVCPENAEYTNCTQAVCRAQNCNQLGQPSKPCAKVPQGKCQQGCVCNQGYLKNKNGTCVFEEDCADDLVCDIYEEVNYCPLRCDNEACPVNLGSDDDDECNSPAICGTPKCSCIEGYRRDETGTCIPISDCPDVCPENAEYTNCTQAVCRAQNCNQLGQPSKPCAKVPQGKCQQGCVCNQGYLKNKNGTCVFEEDCADDLVCDIYEEVNYCPLRCDNEACPVNLGSDHDDECNSPAICGTPKCSCIEGYRRDETGTCIPISDCPDVCPENAEYTNCTQAVCRAQNCNQLGQPNKPCAKVPQGKCQQGCVCNQGYLKNKNGTCVFEEDCADDLVCDIYEEVNYCPLRCDNEACPVNLGSDDDDECNSPAICGTPKCSCIEGYRSDETGTCIPISDCPEVCPENAEYTNCTQAVCRAQNCNQLGQPSKPCAKVPEGKCQQGCVCNQGYLKNNNGTCVFEEDCADDLVCDIYEEVNYCPLRCDNEACPVNLGSDDDDECNSPAICGTPKCSCIEGYRRDETGTCIPISDCPDVCPENAEYTNCTQAVCRAQNCNQLGQPSKPCAKVPQGKCQQGCVCNQGYLKNKNGTCVFEEDCADDLVCDIYEEVNYCPLRCDNEACPVNLGSDDDDECNSPAICGTPKCSCIEGYRRDETGTCIPISDCPDVCPENAEYTNCTQAVCRAQNCNQLGQPNKPCAKVPQGKCQQGCVCNQGYLKNNNGTCVFEEDCADDLVCDIYEEVNYCPLRCDNEACPVNLGSDDDDECNSPAICGTPKCSCIEGYRRDETGTCIPISDCPDVCPENAEYTNCTQAVCRAQNCNQLGQPNKPCAKVPQGKCQQGCVCNQGYLKNNNGTCVFEEDCADDLVCDIYEEVNYCPLRCDNEACPVNLGSDDDDECNSPAICGTPKCSCIEGYRRDETGTCIPISDCPDVCPENAEYTNCTQAVCRAQNCNQLGQPSKPCAKVPEGKCQQGCVCNQGYLKNNNGTCVFEEDCADDLVCDIYEEVNYCPLRCDNEACPVNLGSDDDDECNSPAICGTPKCSCIDGYRRDETGTCIPISDCPDVCPENAEYTNCTQAVCRAQNCNQLGQPSKPCAKVPQGKCQQGCVCNQGYLKNKNGTCVFEEDCADDLVCDIYEEVNYCPLRCDNEACPVNLGSDDDDECNSPAICGTPKCSCIEGYRRDETGTCIPISDCPDVCPENAEYTNCTQAVCRAQNCNQLGQPSKPCAKVPQGKCQQGCVCNQGYLKNKNGTCVFEEDCADDLVCDIYEEVNYCPLRCDNEACPVNLGSDHDDECNSPAICGTPKCSCIEGYRRDETGTCIPISDCPDVCPENAEYTNCTQAVCRAQNCNQLGQPNKPCAKVPQGKCQQGCVCNQGYLKNKNGTCVFEEDCADDLVCDIYEEVNYCPLRCDNEACPVNLGSDDDDECNSPAICGTPKCSCIEGYRSDETGTCIPISDCPEVCPENAEYTNCTQAVCRAQNCNQLGQPSKPCAKVPEGKCQQGCVCNQGYLKNNNGTCVFEEDCADDLVCDIYEEVNYCPLRCDNEACPVNLGSDDDDECNSPAICGTPKCSCIEGYRRDETGTCIPISDCPDVCPENAEYTNCTQAVCRAQNCNQLGQPSKPCAKVPQGKCQQGCVCNQGYLKNKNGTCVFEEDCADDLVCDIYEEVNYCPLRCDNEACPVNLGSDDDDECNSPAICGTPKCSCIEGYRRDETGTCIPISDCPDVCPENAEYTNCTQAVCRAQNCNQLGQPNKPCAKVPQGKCQQGCVCNQGYLKNNNGTCVFEEDCADDLVCDIYEEVNYCPLRCDNEVCPVNLGSDADDECNSPAICGTPKCSCIEGYRRDDNGTCIPISDCPGICPSNEEYSNCTQAVCRAQNCNESSQSNQPCAKVPQEKCQQGCVCKDGYMRSNGTCVLQENCNEKPGQCNAPNEELKCVKDCPPEITCRTRGVQFNCLIDNKPCEQKCVCKTGYYRNAIGECISGNDCDKCQGQNEFFSCGTECDNDCADRTQNRTNCRAVNIVCNPKCYCEDGFARDNKNKCVPLDQCPVDKCSDPNEEFVPCKRNCPMDLCSSLVERVRCEEETFTPGCTCKPGFLRKRSKSRCVPICDCPQMRNAPDCQKSKRKP